MEHNCTNCVNNPACVIQTGQCIDYEHATKEQIKQRAKDIAVMKQTVVDIHEYDASDKVTRELLESFEKKGK